MFCSTLVSPAQPDQVNQRWPLNVNRAPSMAVWVLPGFSTLIRLSACTTSGQFWQLSDR